MPTKAPILNNFRSSIPQAAAESGRAECRNGSIFCGECRCGVFFSASAPQARTPLPLEHPARILPVLTVLQPGQSFRQPPGFFPDRGILREVFYAPGLREGAFWIWASAIPRLSARQLAPQTAPQYARQANQSPEISAFPLQQEFVPRTKPRPLLRRGISCDPGCEVFSDVF